jgi:uncharacterized protein (DUF2235 family)
MPAPYTSLVLCFDGTWNNLKSNTNVSRLYSEIADGSTGFAKQRKFYDEGVGTHWYDRVSGGATGAGLDKNIRLGYAWLATNFETERDTHYDSAAFTPDPTRKPNGDLPTAPKHSSGVDFLTGSDLYLIGFSRGAFTARSLGGLINYLGIPRIDPAKLAEPDKPLAEQQAILDAWDLYQTRPGPDDLDAIKKGGASDDLRQKCRDHEDAVARYRASSATRYPVRIHFIGVWDTVGALGIPRVAWLPKPKTYQFHDTKLGEAIRNAYHAMAIDEHRQEYKATLWTDNGLKTIENIHQRWFPGAHADVGGGYEDDLLPAKPLLWLAQSAARCGLEFVDDRGTVQTASGAPAAVAATPGAFDLIGTEYMSPVHDSYAAFLGGFYKSVQFVPGAPGRVYRRMLVAADGMAQEIDETAFQKWKSDPEYRPPNLGQAGRQDVTYAMARGDDVDVVIVQTAVATDTTATVTETTEVKEIAVAAVTTTTVISTEGAQS